MQAMTHKTSYHIWSFSFLVFCFFSICLLKGYIFVVLKINDQQGVQWHGSLFDLSIHKAKIYYQSAGVENTMTSWMFNDNTGPVLPLSTSTSLVPLRYNGQDDNLLKSSSENMKAGLPLRALLSYTGTTACQE